MKRNFALALGLVLSTTMIGVAYASWTSSIVIAGVAATGTIDLQFLPTSIQVNDSETPGSDIASASVTRVSPYSFSLQIDNAYPGYTGYLHYTVANAGSLPLRIGEFVVGAEGRPSQGTPVRFVDVSGIEGIMLDAGEVSDEFAVKFECGEDLLPNEVYRYTVTITATLWGQR